MESKTVEVTAAFDKTADVMKVAEKRLAKMARLMKHIANYQRRSQSMMV